MIPSELQSDGHRAAIDRNVAARGNLTDQITVFAGSSVSVADDKFMRGFFGLTAAQALAGGRTAYVAKAGIYQVGLDTGLTCSLSDRITARAVASVKHLTDDAERSPVVARCEQLAGGLILM